MANSEFLHYKKSVLHFVRAGSGKEVLLFFHGFGQDHSVYLPIIRTLGQRYTVFVFDLYFHGQSEWGYDEQPLDKSFWKAVMLQFLTQYEIKMFSVVGFSLGGKFALATVEAFPNQCKQIFLLAPDGIKTNFWYTLATYPVVMRRIFKSLIGNYERFEKITQVLIRYKLVDSGLVRFADYQMGTEAKRKRVYYSWVVFRHLTFNLKKLASILNENQIGTTVVVGKHDKVIPPSAVHKFKELVKDIRYEEIDAGHSGLLSSAVLAKFIKT